MLIQSYIKVKNSSKSCMNLLSHDLSTQSLEAKVEQMKIALTLQSRFIDELPTDTNISLVAGPNFRLLFYSSFTLAMTYRSQHTNFSKTCTFRLFTVSNYTAQFECACVYKIRKFVAVQVLYHYSAGELQLNSSEKIRMRNELTAYCHWVRLYCVFKS